MSVVLSLLGFLVGLVVSYVVWVVFAPESWFALAPEPLHTEEVPEADRVPATRDVEFSVEGTTVRASLYLPEGEGPFPGIVMGNGFGGTRDFVLPRFADRFRDAGFAVLAFDFRHFGDSDGEPRQMYALGDQITDAIEAVGFAAGLPEFDAARIGFWGTSAAGGYGIVAAARGAPLACVVGQVAALDAQGDGKRALEQNGVGHFAKLFMHAQRDRGRGRLGLPGHTVPLVGRPGTLAMVNGPGAFEGYRRLVGPAFRNEVCARAILMSAGHNPIDHAESCPCPVLIVSCTQDALVDASSAVRTVEKLGERGTLLSYDAGHFDVYEGQLFEEVLVAEIGFLRTHLVV